MNPLQVVMHEIETVMMLIEPSSINKTAFVLQQHQGRIFVVGEGRSGLMAKAFAMRLMHLGAHVFVIGETITPSIDKQDILVAISGSGRTTGVVDKVINAKNLGCHVISVTTDLDSPLAKASMDILHIPASTKYRRVGETESIQPLSSLFDQTSHLVLDAICLAFSQMRRQSNDDAVNRHSNLE